MKFQNLPSLCVFTTLLGFTGAQKKYCESNPCGPDSQCQEVDKGYKCVCTDGECRKRHFCKDVDCGSDMSCEGLTDGYTCTCTAGDCAGKGFCDPNPCAESETCTQINNGYTCRCNAQFCRLKPDSEICKDVQCPDSMRCKRDVFGHKCTDGKANYYCDTGNRCKEGFTCENNVAEFRCKCNTDGCKKLNEVDFCARNPCKNESVCNGFSGGYSCVFNNEQLNKMGFCKKEGICHNFGVCSNLDIGYTCRCEGNTCQKNEFCKSSTCAKDQTCSSHLAEWYSCTEGTGGKPGSGGGTNPGSGSGTSPGSGSGTTPGSGNGTNPGSGSGTNPGSGSGTTHGSGSGTNPGSGSGTNPGSGSGTNPGSGKINSGQRSAVFSSVIVFSIVILSYLV